MPIDVNEYNRILPIRLAVEQKLLALPGVTGVDVGLKEVGGVSTDTHSIIVFVQKKGVFDPQHEIPKTIEGVPTDVVEATFTHHVAPDTGRYDPVQGGCSIAPRRISDDAGTLGMLVKEVSTGVLFWLSAYHVMCYDDNWKNEDLAMTQPAIADGGRNNDADVFGRVTMGVFGHIDVKWGFDRYVDCAVASTTGRAFSPSIIGVGAPKGAKNARVNNQVKKYGITTRLTNGIVVSTNFTAVIGQDTFYYQIRVNPKIPTDPAFSAPGDSGAAVLDSDGNAIGIVIAGDENAKISIVNPIGQIFSALSVTMP